MHPFRSIRWRIQLWYGLLLTMVTGALLIFFFQYSNSARLVQLDSELTTDLVRSLPRHLPPGGSEPGAEGQRGPPPGQRSRPPEESDGIEGSNKYVVVFRPDGIEQFRSANAPRDVPRPDLNETTSAGRWNGENREMVHVSARGHAVIVGMPVAAMRHEMFVFGMKLLAIGLGLLAIALAVGAWITGAALQPVREIAETARRIAAGDWRQRMPTRGRAEELAELGDVLNESFDRIEESFQHQGRFTADASHELGNPVSIVLSQTQLALDRPREPEEYIKALKACRRAGERMRDLTRDLLDLAGYESGAATRQRNSCDLRELIDEALSAVSDLAAERRTVIEKDIHPVVAEVDAPAVCQAVINLLNNAIKHNDEGLHVDVCLRADGNQARIEISDGGKGIPLKSRPHIFERFHRVDASKGSSGRGLGLAIVKAIAESHRGQVFLQNSARGASFVLLLPLLAEPPGKADIQGKSRG